MENYTPWPGGDSPVQPGEFVDVELRCGKVIKNVAARSVLWGRPPESANDNFKNGGVVVSYRRVGEAA